MLKKHIAFLLFVALIVPAFAAQAKTVEIEGTNTMKFSVENFTVKPGEKVTVKLTNNSKMPPAAMSHDWILLKQDADAKAFDSAAAGAKDNGYFPKSKADEVIAHIGLVAGGESKSVTFTAPDKTGDYEYICTFPGHLAAGMKGTMTVK